MGQRIKLDPATAVEGYRNKRLISGKFDCLVFTNKVWQDVYGYKYAQEYLGKYRKNSTLADLGINTIEEELDKVLQRGTTFPPRGSLVIHTTDSSLVTNKALGICLGIQCAFVGKTDLEFRPVDIVEGYWINKEEYNF